MGWFKKKDKVIDLTEYYNDRQRETSQTKDLLDLTQSSNNSSNTNTTDSSSSGGFFGGIFGDANNSKTSTPSTYGSDESSLDADAKRKRFAKRLKDMTDKMEDISNQIYHLQQRIELLEKKMDVNRF